MTSPLTASPGHRPLSSPRFRSPVFRRYERTIVLLGLLPFLFLLLKELVPALPAAASFLKPAVQVLTDCTRTFFGAVFPGSFLLLTLAYSHPRLDRDQCHLLLLTALFFVGGCFAVVRFLPL